MSDKILEDIKNGKGIPPLPNNGASVNRPGLTTEQRDRKGLTHETFSFNDGKKSRDNNK